MNNSEEDNQVDIDDVGQIDTAPPVEAQFTKNDIIEDDSFIDFGIVTAQAELNNSKEDNQVDIDNVGQIDTVPPVEAQFTKNDIIEGDSFGDFGTATAQAELNNSKEDNQVDNDEFGNFHEVPSKHGGSDNDSFGDFRTSTIQTVLNNSNEDIDVDKDDFGIHPLEGQLAKSDVVDDDSFGDFGTATSQQDDDGFGDFDAAPTLKSQSAKNDGSKDDTFGNFGAAPLQPDSKNESKTYDVDDDDFDDFDSATELAPRSVEDDAFDKYKVKSHRQKSSSTRHVDQDFRVVHNTPECDTPLPPIGRVALGTRNIFAKMQALHSFLDSDLSNGAFDPSIMDEDGLTKVLSIEAYASFREDDIPKKAIHDIIIQTLAEDTGSIIRDDGRGPFNSFVYPLPGFQASQRVYHNQGQLRRDSSIRAIPDVLPIRLPSGKETPLDASSPVTPRDRNIMFKDTMQAAQVPNLEVSCGVETERKSKDIQNFRSKIPDLSFMLKSHLILPE